MLARRDNLMLRYFSVCKFIINSCDHFVEISLGLQFPKLL